MSASGILLFRDFVFNEPEEWLEDLVHEFKVKKNLTVIDVWVQSVNGNVWNGAPTIDVGDEDNSIGYVDGLDVTGINDPPEGWNSGDGNNHGVYSDVGAPFYSTFLGKRYSDSKLITMTLHKNDDDGNTDEVKGQLFVRIVYITPTVPTVM